MTTLKMNESRFLNRKSIFRRLTNGVCYDSQVTSEILRSTEITCEVKAFKSQETSVSL